MPVQKPLKKLRVFQRVFCNFRKFALTVVFDAETVGGNVLNFSFPFGADDDFRSTWFLISIPHSVRVLAIDDDTGWAIVVWLQIIIDRQPVSQVAQSR